VIITAASGCRPPGTVAGTWEEKCFSLNLSARVSTFAQISSTRNDPSRSIGESGSAHRRSVLVWMEWLRRGAIVLRFAMLVPRAWRSGSRPLVVPRRALPTLRWRERPRAGRIPLVQSVVPLRSGLRRLRGEAVLAEHRGALEPRDSQRGCRVCPPRRRGRYERASHWPLSARGQRR
jgi:hypothetical protein